MHAPRAVHTAQCGGDVSTHVQAWRVVNVHGPFRERPTRPGSFGGALSQGMQGRLIEWLREISVVRWRLVVGRGRAWYNL